MKKPTSFSLPLSRFDLNLLPPDARQVGTPAFKSAVIDYFSREYSSGDSIALVSVDDEEIYVATFPNVGAPFDLVMSMLQSGQIKEAVPLLEALDKVTPNDVQVLYNLGIAYSELRQFDEAIIRLKRAVAIYPKHSHAWTGIGVAYERLGNQDQALEAFKKALSADPTDGYGHRNIGALYLNKGSYAEALHHLRIARKALPHDPQTIYGLASALELVGGEDNIGEADDLYKVVIERWPSAPFAEDARTARTKLAQQSLREKTSSGFRPDVMMYIAGALDTFKKVGAKKTKEIAFEVAILGQSGLDIHDSNQKYKLKTLPGNYSGLHLLAIMYTAFKQIDPTLETGADFQQEFDSAMAMQKL